MLPKITVYSDYICPFCFIGKSRVDRLEKRFGMEVEWKGLEIHPEIPPEGGDLKNSLGYGESVVAAIRSRVKELSEEVGLRVELPARISNSRLALKIAEFAKEKGQFREYHHAVFKAYYQEGKDIGRKELLLSIAAEVGLDLKELGVYLESGQADAKLNQHLREAQEYGVDGVPTFIIGSNKIVGAQPYEMLAKVVEKEFSP